MSIVTNYLGMQQQIADELVARSDLLAPLANSGLSTSPIQNAIQSAIAKWERVPFYFTEHRNSNFFSTVNGQSRYTASDAADIGTMANLFDLAIISNNTRISLTRRSLAVLDRLAKNNAASGQPTDFAYFAETISLYPVPNAVFTVAAAYTQRQTALANNTDTSAWTLDGADLIRCEAKLILAREVLFDDELATRCELAIYGNPNVPGDRGYFGMLVDETARRTRPDHRYAAGDDATGAASAANARTAARS